MRRGRGRRASFARASGALALGGSAWLALACTTPLEKGERAYHRGDREEAIATWRGIDASELDYGTAQQRIAAVDEERGQLVERYVQRARYFEERGRLAEAVLDYRLALRLQPADRDALGHVQELSRRLAKSRSEGLALFRKAFDADDLGAARVHIARLRVLDAFSPEIADGQRQLAEALATRIDAIVSRGSAEIDHGDLGDAEKAFESVLDLDPQNVTARGNLAYIARLRGASAPSAVASSADPNPADVAPARASAGRARPREVEIRAEGYFQNALAAEASGDPFQAIQYDRAALDSDETHAGARSHIASLRRALMSQVPMLLDAGRRDFQREDLRAALDQWDRVLLIDPANAEAKEHKARAEKLLERLEQLQSSRLPPVSGRP